jgi:hypothetical protein
LVHSTRRRGDADPLRVDVDRCIVDYSLMPPILIRHVAGLVGAREISDHHARCSTNEVGRTSQTR